MKEVNAVKSESQLEQLEHLLKDRGDLYFDIWSFGINTAFRISDLLGIKIEQVKGINPDTRELTINERKTHKERTVKLNARALEVAKRRINNNPNDEYLFQSTSPRKDRHNGHITYEQVGRVFRQAGKQITPEVAMCTHSMRKTRGYLLYKNGVSIEVICRMLNHSSPAITMRYIGIDAETISKTYDDYVF